MLTREPEALRRLPHVEMIVRHGRVDEAGMRKGIIHRIGERRHAADIRTLANPLGADRMMWRGRGGVIGLPVRCLDRGRQKEIEQARIFRLP